MSRHAMWGLLVLLPLAACNTGRTGPAASGAPAAGAVAGVSAADQGFAVQAAGTDQFEIASARLAVQKARRPAVRAYAQRLLDGHTASSQKLAALAARKGISLPAAPGPAQERTLAELGSNAGGFDAAFVAAQTEAHRAAIDAAQAEAAGGADPELKAYAQAMLPDLQSHLAQAQKLRGGR